MNDTTTPPSEPDGDDLAGRWEAIGNPNPRFLLIRLVKSMVREGRLKGTDDDDIRAEILGTLAERAANQSPGGKEELARLVRMAIKEALAEGPPDAGTDVGGGNDATAILDVFGWPDGMRPDDPPDTTLAME
jgi:hypothetical protein